MGPYPLNKTPPASAACSQSFRFAPGTLRGSLRVIAGWLALPGQAMPIAFDSVE